MLHAHSCLTFNPAFVMSFLKERKRYDFIKSILETTLMTLMPHIDLKDPHDKAIYDRVSEAIEFADSMASRFQTAYDENN